MADDAEPMRIRKIADNFFRAVCEGDTAQLEQLLAAEFRAWHNTDDLWQSRSQHIKVLSWLHQQIASMRYEDVAIDVLEDGFCQRHVLRGTVKDAPFALIAVIIGKIDAEGRLTETREYLDSKALAPLVA